MKCATSLALSAFTLVALAGNAAAVTITIDPGPVGTVFSNLIVPVAELNGTLFDGSTLDVTFEVSDGKALLPQVGPTNPIELRGQLVLYTDSFSDLGTPSPPTGSLRSADGSILLEPVSTDAFEGRGTDLLRFEVFNIRFDEDAVDGLVFSRVFFSLPLQNAPDVTVTSADFRLTYSPSTIQVVPEPATGLLLGVGLVSLARRRSSCSTYRGP